MSVEVDFVVEPDVVCPLDEIQVEHADAILHSGVKAPVIPNSFQAEREDALGSVFMHYRHN